MLSWLSRSHREAAAARVGPLERRVLQALWARSAAASVRDLQATFTEIAYTTLMTTLDRLHRKGLLDRDKRGRAFFYAPRLKQAEFESARAADAIRGALASDRAAAGPLLSFFVRTVGNFDEAALDELEAVVKARRAEIGRQGSMTFEARYAVVILAVFHVGPIFPRARHCRGCGAVS